ncbi:hypothetical protein AAFF_G00024850 [Aldrovandia affinis]|uniref:Uncharacterized protein n=1 Tax=Aldrovandia affinis TaxID=143900 RepID=A0AAD7T5W1_9TELE|nr:hypothetical protein AAFF_G00024850 [Aldrovandia affinis]
MYSKRHKPREAEPKEYDFTAFPERERSLHKSTYSNFGTCVNTGWSTTTGDQLSQRHLETKCEVIDTRRSMVHADLFHSVILDRETDWPKAGHNVVLPRHRPGHNQIDLKTTYGQDYLPRYIHSKKECKVTHEQLEDSGAFRKRISQFTDAANFRRAGRNTWQDESRAYRTVAPKLTNPICP